MRLAGSGLDSSSTGACHDPSGCEDPCCEVLLAMRLPGGEELRHGCVSFRHVGSHEGV